jgi:hypothetical protein
VWFPSWRSAGRSSTWYLFDPNWEDTLNECGGNESCVGVTWSIVNYEGEWSPNADDDREDETLNLLMALTCLAPGTNAACGAGDVTIALAQLAQDETSLPIELTRGVQMARTLSFEDGSSTVELVRGEVHMWINAQEIADYYNGSAMPTPPEQLATVAWSATHIGSTRPSVVGGFVVVRLGEYAS